MFDMLSLATKGINLIKSNLLTFAVMIVVVLFIWWKNLIGGQAETIVNNKDGIKTLAPQQPITLAALTRRALQKPAVILQEAVSLGVFHVKWILAGPLVVVSHPNIASVVLSDKFISDRLVINHEAKGVLGMNGSPHKKAHNNLVTLFASPESKNSLTDALVEQLHARLASETFPEFNEAVSTKENLDLCPVFEELWVDVIGLWVLGVETSAETERREKIVEARRCLANLTFVLPTGISWYFDRLRALVPYTEYLLLPGGRDYLVRRNGKSKARAIVDEEYIKMVKEFKDGKKRGGVAGRLLEQVLASLPEGTEISIPQWEELFAECEAVQTAAQLPLYSIVPHILYLLAHSPTHQKAVFVEASKVNAKNINRSHVANMPQLEAVVLEALRLLPPFVTSYNRSSADNAYKLPGNWSLPKSTHIVVDFLSTMRNTDSFGTDSDAFKPERFSQYQFVPTIEETPAESIQKLKRAVQGETPTFKDGFIPFGGGLFACPGQRLALDVIKVAVAEIVRKYELSGVKGREKVDASEIVKTMEEFGNEQGNVLRHLEGCPVAIKKRK